jgi:CPA1 family monovalent cation:H+ antiporter
MLYAVDDYRVEILLTLALVTGGYALGRALHVSGPLAMVVAGVLIGGRGRRLAMSETTRTRLDEFWELVDELLNAVLFVLIGLEVMLVKISGRVLLAGLLGIPLVLAARFVSVAVPLRLLRSGRALRAEPPQCFSRGGPARRHLGRARPLVTGEPVPR